MAKATTTIRQVLNPQREHGYQVEYAAWFAANQALFNRVCAFYFGVIQAHEKIFGIGMRMVEPVSDIPYQLRVPF